MSGMRRITLVACLALLALPSSSRAEVVDSAANGFTVRIAVDVAASPARVYRTLVDRVGQWWDPEHTWSGRAANMSLDASPGGCFCEKLPGGGVRHLMVVYAEEGKLLRLNGGLGPLQGLAVAGSMTWTFANANGGTRLVLTYTVGGYAPGGVDAIAKPADGMLTGQVQRLKRFIETGKAAP